MIEQDWQNNSTVQSCFNILLQFGESKWVICVCQNMPNPSTTTKFIVVVTSLFNLVISLSGVDPDQWHQFPKTSQKFDRKKKNIYILFSLLLNLILVIVFCHRFSFFLLRALIVPGFNLWPWVLYPVAEIRSWQIAVVRGFGAERVYQLCVFAWKPFIFVGKLVVRVCALVPIIVHQSKPCCDWLIDVVHKSGTSQALVKIYKQDLSLRGASQSPRSVRTFVKWRRSLCPVASLSFVRKTFNIGLVYSTIARFWDADKFRFIQNVWKADVGYEFLGSSETGGKLRKFKAEWIVRFPWLAYSKYVDGAFCLPCVCFGMECGKNGSRLDKLFRSLIIMYRLL